jgi:hypothetical protein
MFLSPHLCPDRCILFLLVRATDMAKIDGLWTAEFGTSAGTFGGGVAVFQEGKVLGGDGSYFYVGQYALSERSFTATLKVAPFLPNAESVFKTAGKELKLDLVGSLESDMKAVAQGQAEGIPGVRFGVKLTKQA